MGDNVYLFIPNLIGYFRIFSLFVALLCFYNYPLPTAIFYSLSQLLDCLDGFAARKYNQSTQFGAVLDMVTDRVSSAAFALCLSHFFPDFVIGFCLFVILDFGSHWIQMYATLLCGEKHHKTQQTNSRLMKIYYQSRYVLFIMCFGSEMFLINLYIQGNNEKLGMSPNLLLINKFLMFVIALPIFALKQVISLVCMMSSVEKIIACDLRARNENKTK